MGPSTGIRRCSIAVAWTLTIMLTALPARSENPACGHTLTIGADSTYHLSGSNTSSSCSTHVDTHYKILGSPSGLASMSGSGEFSGLAISVDASLLELWIMQYDGNIALLDCTLSGTTLSCSDSESESDEAYLEILTNSGTLHPTFGGAGQLSLKVKWGHNEAEYGPTGATFYGRSTDVDADGDTDDRDKSAMRSAIAAGTPMSYDLNWDGHVDNADLAILLQEARRRDGGLPYRRGHCVDTNDAHIAYADTSWHVSPPWKPYNLNASPVACGVYSLSWTSSGDDGAVGRAYEYEIRSSSSEINAGNFSSASLVATVTPVASGSSQSVVTGVATSTSSGPWFAIRARDSVGTLADTLAILHAPTVAETTVPATTSSMTAVTFEGGGTAGQARLRWTSAGDDGTSGTPTSYDVRMLTSPISSSGDWASAEQVATPSGVSAGTLVTIYVPLAICNQTYYFALKTVDDQGNCSAISNSPSTDGGCYEEGIRAEDNTDRAKLPVALAITNGASVSGRANFTLSVPPRLAGTAAKLVIHDVLGRQVATVFTASMSAGTRLVSWNLQTDGGGRAPVGVYTARFLVKDEMKATKFSVLR